MSRGTLLGLLGALLAWGALTAPAGAAPKPPFGHAGRFITDAEGRVFVSHGLPAKPQAGFPGNYLVQPAVNRAFDNFWANAAGPGGVGTGDRYAAAWQHVGSRFASDDGILGYDLLNEPWPGSGWQQCANPA